MCVGSLHVFSLPILGLGGRKVSWAKKKSTRRRFASIFFPFFSRGEKLLEPWHHPKFPFLRLSRVRTVIFDDAFFHHQSAYSSAGIAMLFFYILKKVRFNLRTRMFLTHLFLRRNITYFLNRQLVNLGFSHALTSHGEEGGGGKYGSEDYSR